MLLGLIVSLAVLYLFFAGFIFWSMHQSPEAFGRVMAKMPQSVVFLFLPFETLWSHARAGSLQPGDSAPDFSLQQVDRSGFIQLSQLNQRGPVVLVFGSYT
jgi:hypothetical protein